jgi:VWFA-related protein
LLPIFLFLPGAAVAQTGDGTVTFKSGVNVVTVPVVVRDAAGNVVSDLRKDDFTLLDNGAPVVITSFRVEKPGHYIATEKPVPGTEKSPAKPMVIPDHFIAYVFDDMGMDMGDRVWAQKGAMRHVATLKPGDRAAIFTTSCWNQVDFTDDHAKLLAALAKIGPQIRSSCPGAQSGQPVLIPGGAPVPGSGEVALYALADCLSRAVARMSTTPGQRSMVFVSGGGSWEDDIGILQKVIDRAIRARVVINTLNARGPETPPLEIGGNNPQQLEASKQAAMKAMLSARLGLSALAYGTGGTAVENTNDADAAYRRLDTPESIYMLGFSPDDAKLDGKVHHLKVSLNGQHKLNLQARSTWFAATAAQRAAQTSATAPALVASEAEGREVAETLGISQPPSHPITFKASTNLVLVPVVVRDSHGNVVGNLTKENFQLFDRGKLQDIQQFAVEKPGQHIAEDKSVEGVEPASVNADEVGALQKHAPMVIPDRFVALVFDDFHLKMGGMDVFDQGYLIWARDAARRYIATLKPSDRVAIVTTTGNTALDFTSDREKLEQTLLKLHTSPDEKPKGFPSALGSMPAFDQMNRTDEWEARRSLEKIQDFIKRMSVEPGQRTMVFLSKGFGLRQEPAWTLLPETTVLVNRAIQSGVVINTLNIRGLAPEGNGPDELLFRLSDGTGGTYVRNRNDYDSALHQLADAPESRYVLGFAPQNLKEDGSSHDLKVKLIGVHGLDAQARRFYWDAKPAKEKLELAGDKSKGAAVVPTESKAEEKELADSLGIQQPPTAPPADSLLAKTDVPTVEIAPKDQTVTFQAKVNLVTVPVVVRNVNGQAVGTLTKQDFQLFDKGKKQEITKFSVEKTSGQGVMPKPVAPQGGVEGSGEAEKPVIVPENFVIYLFDDVHLKFGDLVYVRDAAGRNIDTLPANARAAIYTTSGQNAVDFTDDRAKLHAALLKLRPRALTGSKVQECPDISYYMADQIERNNPTDYSHNMALQAAAFETLGCMHLDPTQLQAAISLAQSAASRALSEGDHESRVALISLKDIVRRISAMPGRRNIILVSPGFFFADSLRFDEMDVVERAVRANVVISSLDARGLYTLIPGGDIDQRQYDTNSERIKDQYRTEDAVASSGVLMEMASGTGGTFINNTNDMDGSFRKLASAPEYVYMLGFAPENLKPDGSFHALKVKLNSGEKFTLQARHGYFAPKGKETEVAAAKEEIDSAVFSREEIHELPVELHTQFFKPSDTEAKLKVLASVDLRHMAFRKDDGRNRNDLTVVSALFDNNGNFVAGLEKIVQMRLLDTTVDRLKQAPPIKVTSSFDVKPGSYLIRLVVRDAEGKLMATENGAVEIP